MAKSHRRDTIIKELKLMAAGANGGDIIECRANLVDSFVVECFVQFAWSVHDRWFRDNDLGELFLFRVISLEAWKNFDTLADSIIAERARLKRVAEQEKTT